MMNEHLSTRATARQVGVAHTTLGRILEGANCDVETLQKLSSWLGVPTSTLADLGDKDSLAKQLSAFLHLHPKLVEVLSEAIYEIENQKIDEGTLRDILAYKTFRMKTVADRPKEE